MNTLVAVGTSAAFAYSAGVVLFPNLFGNSHGYFDTTATIITLILLGKFLESGAKNRASDAIKKLIGLQPKEPRVVRNGSEHDIAIDDVLVGDVVIVRPGERIPVDGIILKGITTVDEGMVTEKVFP